MVRLIALDEVLWFVLCSVVDIAFQSHVGNNFLRDDSPHSARFRVPFNMVAAFECLAHRTRKPFCVNTRGPPEASCQRSQPACRGLVRRANVTLSARRGTLPCRSSCARKPRLLFRADTFQSWDAPRLVRRSAACPPRRLTFPKPSLEWFGFQ